MYVKRKSNYFSLKRVIRRSIMKRKRSLNDMGVWLMNELNCRDIRSKEFAAMIKTTPQNLSDILRGNRFSASTLQRWKMRFENALTEIDEKQGIDLAATIVYQATCTNVIVEGNTYTVYGIQMLSGKPGHYFVEDEIQDITLQANQICRMVDLLNCGKVSAVHFRDVVMDSILQL